MVTVRESHSAGLLLRLLEERPDVGRYVKSLCITANELDSAPLILSLVDACPSVENLALWNHNDSSLVLDRIAYQPLRRLSLMSSHFTVHSDPKRIFGERAFEHITHLDIADIPVMTHWMATRWHFRRVAHLTHLRLRFVYPSDPYLGELLALPILSASPAMQVLLVEHHPAADTIACLATVTRMAADRAFDPRLVLIIDHSDAMRAWEAPVRGRRDAWASGEKHVRLQRSHSKPPHLTIN